MPQGIKNYSKLLRISSLTSPVCLWNLLEAIACVSCQNRIQEDLALESCRQALTAPRLASNK